MAQALADDFPEVKCAVSITPLWGIGLTKQTLSFRNPESTNRFDENGVMAVDSNFFKVFSFPLLKGDPNTVLGNPDGILISGSMSKKYFGEEDPLGKHLAVNDEQALVEVVGFSRTFLLNLIFILIFWFRTTGKIFEDPK